MVLLALVGSCLEPVATVVKERAVISLQVIRVPVSVRARSLQPFSRAVISAPVLVVGSLVRGSNISDATLAIAVKAQTVKAS